MIIQNLHKNRRLKTKGRKLKLIFWFLLFFCFCPFTSFSQDSIPLSIGVPEKNNTEFQENFFKALSHKAIFNYKKAIEHLEKCNEILPSNKAVLFELSKNYYQLNRNIEALEFINLALKEENNNLWMLEHKVTILRRIADFDEAIKTQLKIAEKYPKKKRFLVYLHLQNNDLAAAKQTLLELKNAKLLNSRLRSIQEKINSKYEAPKPSTIKEKNAPKDLRTAFEKEKTYNNLKLLLDNLLVTNDKDLLKYSELGLTLFPAQPYVYLTNGKALNNKEQYKKALVSLQNGIDFVIDNNKIEAEFYLEIARAYQGLKEVKKANTYKNKAAKILK